METIEEAKNHIKEKWHEGVECPCCTQRVQLYHHKLGGLPLVMLCALYRHDFYNRDDYQHVSKMDGYNGNGDFAKLRHWGLIEEMPKDPDDEVRRTSGYWKITARGRLFVENAKPVPSHAYLFDSRCFGYSEKMVTFSQALPKKFNYTELMQSGYGTQEEEQD